MMRYGDRIRDLFRIATDGITIIAPYIKLKALEALLQDVDDQIPIRCVTRWQPRDIAAGVSDPEIFDLLAKRPSSTITLVDNLHAKIYIAGRRCLVGSANVTLAGLGDALSDANVEVLVETTTDDLGVEDVLAQIARLERPATAADAEGARRLAEGLRPFLIPLTAEARFWSPRSVRPDLAYRLYAKSPTGFIGSAERVVLADVAAANIPPGMNEARFREEIRSALAACPLAKELLESGEDRLLRKMDVSPMLKSLENTTFSVDDIWRAFVAWMVHFHQDTVIQQDVTELALRRARLIQ